VNKPPVKLSVEELIAMVTGGVAPSQQALPRRQRDWEKLGRSSPGVYRPPDAADALNKTNELAGRQAKMEAGLGQALVLLARKVNEVIDALPANVPAGATVLWSGDPDEPPAGWEVNEALGTLYDMVFLTKL
jgi:hypothetical protein